MVKSQLLPGKIDYNEDRQIDEDDVGYASTRYENNHFNIPIEIAIGREKYTYSAHNIIYFSVYLVVNNTIKDKIGIVEIDSKRFIDSIDEDGDFILDNGNIIFFVDDKYISRMMKDVIDLTREVHIDENVIDLTKDVNNDEDENEPELIHIEEDIELGDVDTLDSEVDNDVLNVDIPENKRSKVVD